MDFALPASHCADAFVALCSHSANPDLYPTAHTCFRRIDLPGLTDMAELERRLRFCLDNLEMSGFGEQ